VTEDLFPGFESRVVAGDGAYLFCRLGGDGPPVVLLHGYPQTHVMWHRIAPELAERCSVVALDLRGYGRSEVPADDEGHVAYSKRTMARDVRTVMGRLGYDRFSVVGHDRGGRVAYRLALDEPDVVERVAVLDILPTAEYWDRLTPAFGLRIYHWMFLAQPAPLPERLISAEPRFYCDHTLASWTASRSLTPFDPIALENYRAQFEDPARVGAMCADYRAGATVDLAIDAHDRAEGRVIGAPLLDLWGSPGITSGGGHLDVWRRWATDAHGAPVDSGHFLPEENPRAVLDHLVPFLTGAETR
jgi:haloacetate dehalogenase